MRTLATFPPSCTGFYTSIAKGPSIILNIKNECTKYTLLGGVGGQWKKTLILYSQFQPIFYLIFITKYPFEKY